MTKRIIMMLRKNLKTISVKWRVFFFLMGFSALLIVLLWVFQIVSLDSFYKYVKINEAKSFSATIIKNISRENLQETIDDIAASNDVCIEIISDKDDSSYISSTGLRDCILHILPISGKASLYQKAKENNNTLIEYFDGSRDGIIIFPNLKQQPHTAAEIALIGGPGQWKSFIYVCIFTDKEGYEHVVMINSRISPVDATVKTLRVQIIYVSLFMTVLSIILALLIARIISKPIEKINRSAKELAKGDYDIHFEGSGYKEISELAETLNYTAVELGKVDGLRKELIANISHDLRTPLTLITGYSEIMRDLPGENTPENAKVIIDESKRLTSLVNDMLTLSKIQSGSQELTLSGFNLTHVVREATERFARFCEQEGYMIQFDYSEDVTVTADEVKMTQVLYNLLTNAINYTGDDKLVRVRQSIEERQMGSGQEDADMQKERGVKIEIADTGEGIEPESLQYIWDRYYKVDKTHKRAVTGTGLGLSIVKSILDLHEGAEYGVDSTQGEGTTFWFSLKC